MAHWEITRQEEPIRLFRSNFLEFFTHIHPGVVAAIWLPFIGYLFFAAFRQPANTPVSIGLTFLFGLFLWTAAEYLLHRFLFHHPPRTKRQERIFFLFHGVHHAQPQCKTRLVMPPVVSIPLAAVFFGLFAAAGQIIGRPEWVPSTLAGFTLGYLIYDITHYATHHFPMRWKFLKFLKRYHMQHHYKTPDLRFGVSSPLWDVVFGTFPRD